MSSNDKEAQTTAVTGADGGGGAEQLAAGKPASSSKSFVAVFAVLISLVALAASGWSAWQLSSMRDLPNRINGDASKLADVSARVDSLGTLGDRQQQLIDDLEGSLESGLSVVPDLALRVRQTEARLAELPGVNIRIRADWLKKEALYYMKIANAQAALVGDPQVAASALQLADEKLRDAGDPSLTAVRAQLSREIAALQAVPVVDQTGIAFKLQSLADQAGQWPFRRAAPESYAPDIIVGDEQELGPWDRFVATAKEVLSSIISVKQTDEPVINQLGSADELLIVETIKAELQVARLAFVRGNNETFRQSLTSVDDQLKAFFDADAAAVQAAQRTLDELEALELPSGLPDISGSLAMMIVIAGESANVSESAPAAKTVPKPAASSPAPRKTPPAATVAPKPKPAPEPEPVSKALPTAPEDKPTASGGQNNESSNAVPMGSPALESDKTENDGSVNLDSDGGKGSESSSDEADSSAESARGGL